jgi:hypothetical protein
MHCGRHTRSLHPSACTAAGTPARSTPRRGSGRRRPRAGSARTSSGGRGSVGIQSSARTPRRARRTRSTGCAADSPDVTRGCSGCAGTEAVVPPPGQRGQLRRGASTDVRVEAAGAWAEPAGPHTRAGALPHPGKQSHNPSTACATPIGVWEHRRWTNLYVPALGEAATRRRPHEGLTPGPAVRGAAATRAATSQVLTPREARRTPSTACAADLPGVARGSSGCASAGSARASRSV